MEYDRYGEKSYEYSVCELVEEERLDEREIYWISRLDTFLDCDKGYNKSCGGEGVGKGENHPCARFDKMAIVEIRKEYKDNSELLIRDICRKRKVDEMTIGRIIRNKTYFDKDYIPPTKEEINKKKSNNAAVRMIGDKNPNFGKYGEANSNFGKYGVDSPNAVFTNAQIVEIRKKYNDNVSLIRLASMYDVSDSTIGAIVRNERYVDDNYHPPEKNVIRVKVTWELVEKIRERFNKDSPTQVSLAREFKVSVSCINNIVRNKTWVI